MKKPSDFRTHPYASVFGKSEHETVARNIMVILARTGNEFRELTYEEYVTERMKDGNYGSWERKYFDAVLPYCQSAEIARTFSLDWDRD